MHTRLAIIILHYKNYQETIACVNSALKQKGGSYEIVVVDNGSGDGSYEILTEHFKKVPHVTIKRLKKNLGFARGNNAGIRYARAQFSAKNCFICNSDVVFEDTLFEELLAACKKGVGVISPAVYDADKKPQPFSVNIKSPYKTILFTLLYILYKSLPEEMRKKLFLQFIKLLYLVLKKGIKGIYRLRTYLKKHNFKVTHGREKGEAEKPYCMQGCAFLLTEEYFNYYRGLYPKTFLYGEELNITLYLKKAGLLAVAVPTSPVIHKGRQSSVMLTEKEGERRRLILSRQSLFNSLPLLFLSSKKISRFY
ncbi:glycosyltransferase [Anaerocolumna xylanovorans]|uniref:Glycosyltransferase, GT2 family n=1 Tax=Anaerocolumna xylanovorans DSM 12503 TaxID=1121345 RepID=A0A1M7Y1I8_9FIRM|nr:glycosyltransferase [Anaerocolumna xylanovorans]SHO45653.1 Glycosyltransferase, GT2 family [Anaerocolumna xylanovorans DSM 12503]